MATGVPFIDSLFPASFRGLSFWVQTDSEHGGRRLAVYEYPHGEDHDVEDLGRSAKHFKVTAYLVGDDVLSQSKGLKNACDQEGAGTLILPEQGTQQGRCQSFERSRGKDQHGFIGFDLAFVLEGAGGSVLPSTGALAQMGFDAVAGLAGIAAPVLAGAFALAGQPSYVAAAVADGLTDIPAVLDGILSGAAVDPAQILGLRQQFADLYAAGASAAGDAFVDSAVLTDAFTASIALADAMAPMDAASAFGAALDALA